MKSLPSRLGRALILSLVLHAALIYAGMRLIAPAIRIESRTQPDLKVSLRERLVEPVAPAQPQLLLSRDAGSNANAAAPVIEFRPRLAVPGPRASVASPAVAAPPRLEGEAARRVVEQLRGELPYPPEAVERGLQGEALVLLFLDASGNAIAARLESSSGHALLDDAAIRAVRTLRALPDSAPREALVPVRFRLR